MKLPSQIRTAEGVLRLLDYALAEALPMENSIQRGRLLIAIAAEFVEAVKIGEFEARIAALEKSRTERDKQQAEGSFRKPGWDEDPAADTSGNASHGPRSGTFPSGEASSESGSLNENMAGRPPTAQVEGSANPPSSEGQAAGG